MMTGSKPTRRGAVQVGVDVGGTFTDAVATDGTRTVVAKVPTVPRDQSIGVVDAVRAALDRLDASPDAVARFAHGMTVGTNALLEHRLAPAALVATSGHGDVLELRRQNRADLYRLDRRHPPPPIPRERVVEVDERCTPDGVLIPLEADAVNRTVSAVRELDVEAVAVCLLFSFAHPRHEHMIAGALRKALPDLHVSVSSEVLPEIREYERAVTTAVDAALTPVLRGYLTRLAGRAHAAGLPEPQIMQSSGGLISLDGAAANASRTVLSGPAAGVIGAAALAAEHPVAITFDMGGTSCDVALVTDGAPGRTGGTVINGQPLHLPMLDVVTVSAGGGSIAWADSGRALRVGPRSAGAEPGPAAYGHGGHQATVTDANVVLGRLPAEVTMGGGLTLDHAAAAAVLDDLAGTLALTRTECALGIVRVANQEMARAVRRVSVERGIDPRGAALIAFGGAGPLHACEVADEVGATRVLVPRTAGVLAAMGLVAAGERRDMVQTVLLATTDAEALQHRTRALVDAVAAALPDAGVSVSADCRYVGQRHALTVTWPDGGASVDELEHVFHRAHDDRFGGSDPDHPVEVVSLRVAAERGADPPPPLMRTPDAPVTGPAPLCMEGATVWVADGWCAHRTTDGGFDLERVER